MIGAKTKGQTETEKTDMTQLNPTDLVAKMKTLGKSSKSALYRHGDVMVSQLEAIPSAAKEKSGSILARGEFTGHSHRIQESAAVQLWELNGETFLEVKAERATLIHEEHKPIVLAKGLYRYWMQREYTPQAIVRVMD